MSEIDIQNSRQIRDPMDVLITMSLADDDVTMTYSGYSSAKVADGRLNQPTWPMRKLADLQGEGFPLDGSCVLYDASTTPSQANGKLGVRSNIGETVSVTVTGNKAIASLTIFATGAESVTFGGTTTNFINNQVIIPVGATSITLTFNPANETERIEVSEIVPGTMFRITNENLIRATVSLRSDLSIIDPTLPESEINIEVYQDTDISEAVASIPDDTPITYSAGYEGDMSPERKFYVSGQVTWADNVLTIHGVDAVHFLDVQTPIMYAAEFYHDTPYKLVRVMARIAKHYVGDLYTGGMHNVFIDGGKTKEGVILPKDTTVREIIAELNNVMRFRGIPSRYVSGSDTSFVFNYVDAGAPELWTYDRGNRRHINEEDCADIQKEIEKKIGGIKFTRDVATVYNGEPGQAGPNYDGVPVGTAQILKDEGVFLSLEDYVFSFLVGIEVEKIPPREDPGFTYTSLVPALEYGPSYVAWPRQTNGRYEDSWLFTDDSCMLMSGDTKNGEFYNWSWAAQVYNPIYAQVIPWSIRYPSTSSEPDYPYRSLTTLWNGLKSRGLVDNDANYFDVTLYGYKVNFNEETVAETQNELLEQCEMSSKLKGRSMFWSSGTNKGVEAYPLFGLKELLRRSNKTCSFRWKGDPRIQPRDVFTWHLTDGSEEDWTFENITLTHEGGGTYADITARKGVV